MKKYFDNIIKVIKAFLIEVGEISYFAKRFFKEFLFPPYEFKEILKQCYYIGNHSLFWLESLVLLLDWFLHYNQDLLYNNLVR